MQFGAIVRPLMVLGGVLAIAQAQAVFDFESLSGTPGDTASIVLTDGGITATFYNADGTDLDVRAFQTGRPASWGNVSIWTNEATGATRVNFSHPILYASIQLGDYGPSDEDALFLRAYSAWYGGGSLLDSDSFLWTEEMGFPNFKTLSVSSTEANPIWSLELGATSAFGNSIFFDNLTVREDSVGAVPEPFTMGLIAAGLGAAALRRRKN